MTTDQHPDLTHRPLTEGALDLDGLAPRERARVEAVMAQIGADMDAIMAENFIGQQTEETVREQAVRLVESWNKDEDGLRLFAESMTGFPVESCKVVLDGVDGSNLLISYQIERARRGEHFDRWKAEQESTFADAREVAKRVLHENLPEDGLERGEVTEEQMGHGIAALVTKAVQGDLAPGESTFIVETPDGDVRVDVTSPDADPED